MTVPSFGAREPRPKSGLARRDVLQGEVQSFAIGSPVQCFRKGVKRRDSFRERLVLRDEIDLGSLLNRQWSCCQAPRRRNGQRYSTAGTAFLRSTGRPIAPGLSGPRPQSEQAAFAIR